MMSQFGNKKSEVPKLLDASGKVGLYFQGCLYVAFKKVNGRKHVHLQNQAAKEMERRRMKGEF